MYVGEVLFAFVRRIFCVSPDFTHSAEAGVCAVNILRILNETEKNN